MKALDFDHRDGRFARTKGERRIRPLIEQDLYRHSLYDLHIVTGRIFWRQQAESCTATCLETVYVSGEFMSR